MDCREAQQLAGLCLDGEADPGLLARYELHLNTCTRCRERIQPEQALTVSIRQKLAGAETRAPVGLRTRVVAHVRAHESRSGYWVRRAVPATMCVSFLVVLSWRSSEAPIVPEEAVSRHGGNLPPEVRAEGDQARVQRFLRTNLSYPVAVPRLDAKNPSVRLVGARLSSLEDKDAAYMMYDHRGARVSVFAYPRPRRFASRPEGFRELQAGPRRVLLGQQRGYNVVRWEEEGVVYSMVSDVDPRELVDLASFER